MKTAYETKDIAVIDPALEKINEAWKVASEEMYKAEARSSSNGAPDRRSRSRQPTNEVMMLKMLTLKK